MGISIGVRSIWIGLRAMNYTSQAFRDVDRDVEKVKNSQKELQRQSLHMIQAGIMWMTLGSMFGLAISNMIRASVEGSMYMAKFDQRMSEVIARIGDALLRVLKPALDVLISFLEWASQNQFLASLIAWLMVLGTAVVFLGGAFLGLKGIMGGSIMNIFIGLLQMLDPLTIGMLKFSAATHQVGIAAIGVAAGLAIFFALRDVLGPIPAAMVAIGVAVAFLALQLWLAAKASIMLTGGLAAIGGTIALAGLAAGGMGEQQSSSVPVFHSGTRMVSRTGLAVVQAGEEIRNNQRGLPTDSSSKNGMGNIQTNTFDMRGATILTKANKEELRPFILKTLREGMTAKEI